MPPIETRDGGIKSRAIQRKMAAWDAGLIDEVDDRAVPASEGGAGQISGGKNAAEMHNIEAG